jgi:peptidoglycan/xylan/chitin deacetylase (PgdA/CDA1 family)
VSGEPQPLSSQTRLRCRKIAALLLVLSLAGCSSVAAGHATSEPNTSVHPTTTVGSTGTSPPAPSTTFAPKVHTCPPAPYGAQRHAPSIKGGGKTVALTFDDGPGPSTGAILAILLHYKVRATFFDIGAHEARLPKLVTEESRDGFLVGSHTWSHPYLTKLSPASQAAQLDKTSKEQEELTDSSPCVFRPPFGRYNAATLVLARKRHMSVWLWSDDTQDWKADGSGSSYWVNRIIHRAESIGITQKHPVVIMHNEAIAVPALVSALPAIIHFFKAHGYAFVDLLGRSGPP